jgi:UvrD-like helicase family protein
MSLLLFEGAAGTGKTTRLLGAAQNHLSARPLEPEHRVLALTKFHGSRKRMEARLKGRQGLGNSVDCVTIDSFAWHLLRRWQALALSLGLAPTRGDFQAISQTAGLLLRQRAVATWVARRYPLLIVDELQDCKGGEVEILAGLAPHIHCICAADAFQDLSGSKVNEAISWAASEGDVVSLDHVHRTDVEGLLSAARALRNRAAVNSDHDSGFEIRTAATAPMAGGIISWCIQLSRRFGQIVVISPTKPGTSSFVDGLLDWVATNRAKSRKSAATSGPFSVHWETGDDELRKEVEEGLELPDDPTTLVECTKLAERAQLLGAHDVRDWLLRQENVGGRYTVSVGEMREQVGYIIRYRRVFGRIREGKCFALTVHQAKNREFDSVIALWPLRVQNDPEQQRRLLYNAITRAKRQAVVLVEDPKRNRLDAPPFIAS